VYFGGTELLALFLEAVFASNGGKVHLVSPFVTDEVLTARRLGSWRSLTHKLFSITVVTRTAEDGVRVGQILEAWPWRRLELATVRKLHGKVYLLRESSGAFVGMVGSHNLTQGGLRDNIELGVFFRGLPGNSLQAVFDRCEREVMKLAGALDQAPVVRAYRTRQARRAS